MRRLILASVLAVILAGAAGSAASATGTARADLEQEFVAAINELRVSEGLRPFEVHGELVAKARSWSATMSDEGRIWHSDLFDAITVRWRLLGENVGMGGSVRALHDAFVASPSHYKNLVDPGFEYVGVGVIVAPDGTLFVTEEFMTLTDVPASGRPSNDGWPFDEPPSTTTGTAPATSPATAPDTSAPAARPVPRPAPRDATAVSFELTPPAPEDEATTTTLEDVALDAVSSADRTDGGVPVAPGGLAVVAGAMLALAAVGAGLCRLTGRGRTGSAS